MNENEYLFTEPKYGWTSCNLWQFISDKTKKEYPEKIEDKLKCLPISYLCDAPTLMFEFLLHKDNVVWFEGEEFGDWGLLRDGWGNILVLLPNENGIVPNYFAYWLDKGMDMDLALLEAWYQCYTGYEEQWRAWGYDIEVDEERIRQLDNYLSDLFELLLERYFLLDHMYNEWPHYDHSNPVGYGEYINEIQK